MLAYTYIKQGKFELLQDMAEGKTLDDAEMEYVKIFANLKDFEIGRAHV